MLPPDQFFGAGIAFVEPTRQEVLLLRRAPGGSFGGHWNTPGGKKEAKELLIQTATRETLEEMGVVPPHQMRTMTPVRLGKRFYGLFIATVTPQTYEELKKLIKLRESENSEFAWVSLSVQPDLLHPGLKSAWPVIKKIAEGAHR